MSAVDPVDGLLLVASVRRAAYRAKPPRLFLASLVSRLAAMLGCDRSLIESMIPDRLAAKDDLVRDGYDLPPAHYMRKTEVADKLAAVLLFEPAVAKLYEVRNLDAESVHGHVLCDILLAVRVSGEPLDAAIGLEDMRVLVELYQGGGCFGWHAALYVEEVLKLLKIEAAFRAALM